MPRISLKALILSNLAHWVFFVLSMIVGMSAYLAIATIEANGQSDLHTLLELTKTSPALIMTMMVIFLIMPIPAGYIAAKIAPRDKLINGGMATAAWMVFSIYTAIWGGQSEGHAVQVPHWLDLLASWAVPIPAVFGAYLWQLRANKRATEIANAPAGQEPQPEYQQPGEAPATAVARAAQSKRRNLTRGSTGLAVFLILLSHFLLTEHERNMVALAIGIAFVVLLIVGLTIKTLKKAKPST